jgi:hypothetical protein
MSNIKAMRRIKVEAIILYFIAITAFIFPFGFYIRASGFALSFLGLLVAFHMFSSIEDILKEREEAVSRRLDRLLVPRFENVVIEKEPPLISIVDLGE